MAKRADEEPAFVGMGRKKESGLRRGGREERK